ncbi:hypothetical protein QQF64_034566 [Cirrhinus molitorella]|uniref:Uncharacterized protein n=1 Tax=Cirrhinus molitorella TaxID=172907 RepID=A0ABR3L4Z8_9TELE
MSRLWSGIHKPFSSPAGRPSAGERERERFRGGHRPNGSDRDECARLPTINQPLWPLLDHLSRPGGKRQKEKALIFAHLKEKSHRMRKTRDNEEKDSLDVFESKKPKLGRLRGAISDGKNLLMWRRVSRYLMERWKMCRGTAASADTLMTTGGRKDQGVVRATDDGTEARVKRWMGRSWSQPKGPDVGISAGSITSQDGYLSNGL